METLHEHPRPVLLTIVEAGRMLRIGRTSMYQLVAAGEVEVIHIGRCAPIPADALDAFVARRRAEISVTPEK